MTTLEAKAEQVAKQIGRKFLNLTVPARTELAEMLVREFQPMVIEQVRLQFTEADVTKNAEQAKKMLALLKERRSVGATNVELRKAANALNHTARISELKRPPHNYRIRTEREGNRVFRYTLAPEDW